MRVTIIVLSSLLLIACAPTKHLKPQQRDIDAQEWNTLTDVSARVTQGEVNEQWWADFQDEQLSQIVQVVLESNYDIRIAAQRVESLRQTAKASKLFQFPRLTGQAGYADERRSLNRSDFPIDNRDVETYNAGLAYEWELDVFGRVNKQARLDKALYGVEKADQRAVNSMLVADAVRTYVRYRSSQLQETLLKQQLDRQQKRHQLNLELSELGQLSDVDVLASSQQLNSLKGALLSLQADGLRARYELTVLAGGKDLSEYLDIAPSALPSVSDSILLSSLSTILQQRPDVVAAKQRLQAAIANYQIQHSLWWPRITLNGSLGYVATNASDLGKASSEARVFNPRLEWSGINFLSLKAKIKSANADAQVRLLEYERAVVQAINEVHGAIRIFGLSEQQVLVTQLQAKSAADTAGLVKTRFDKGIGNQFDVYGSEDTEDQSFRDLIINEEQLLLRLVDVYRAVGV